MVHVVFICNVHSTVSIQILLKLIYTDEIKISDDLFNIKVRLEGNDLEKSTK